MSGNKDLLEYQITDHAHDLLAIHTVREYEGQIGEWQKYINNVVDAEKEAVANHQKVLNEMAAEEKAKAELEAKLAMLALSFLTGPLLSWISGTIQYKLVPKLTGKVNQKFVENIQRDAINRIGSDRIGDIPSNQVIGSFTEETHEKIAAKTFGDFAKARAENIGSGVMSVFSSSDKQKIPERGKGNSYQQLTSLANQTSSVDQMLASLKTTLENALIDERTKTTKAISDLGLYIKRHLNWGKLTLQEMYKVKPETKKLSGKQLEWEAYKYVEGKVDEERKKWSEQWIYYGYNPPNTSIHEMSRMIERELWALWILDQDYKVITGTRHYYGKERESWEYTKIEGKDKLPFGQTLLGRLANLNIIDARTQEELQKSIINKQQMESENITSVSGISGDVDEADELNKIEGWIKKYPRLTFTRPDNVRKRTIGKIVDYAK